MDTFREIASFSDILPCELSCDALEQAGIPVMIQHSEQHLRLLVSARFEEKALALLSALSMFRSAAQPSYHFSR